MALGDRVTQAVDELSKRLALNNTHGCNGRVRRAATSRLACGGACRSEAQ